MDQMHFQMIFTVACTLSLGMVGMLMTQGPQKIINSIGMRLVLIPNGTFTMGSPPSEEDWEDEDWDHDEHQHEVTISKDYYLAVTAVTQGQYEKVMGTNPSFYHKGVLRKLDGSMYPVEQVSWNDAVKFCKKLSKLPVEKKAGRVYRLPTEAEWEYACRAGSKTAFSFGDDPDLLGDFAWFWDNSNGQTQPVGQKKPNVWGLYDMYGNVDEWCSDRYGDYPKGAVTDPTGSNVGSLCVIRGGGWIDSAEDCGSAMRAGKSRSSRTYFVGFRVALSPSVIPK